ncbi:unnamed protein product [Protopolystoma xenopodis]|uniref:Uncharacterized protein n=1 Tax=Protopolystoma xenopodis TaxID=117903 RepID=A0A448X489_9PLAT|nr:unnamed protein product [Protopolystoma xenopodis]
MQSTSSAANSYQWLHSSSSLHNPEVAGVGMVNMEYPTTGIYSSGFRDPESVADMGNSCFNQVMSHHSYHNHNSESNISTIIHPSLEHGYSQPDPAMNLSHMSGGYSAENGSHGLHSLSSIANHSYYPEYEFASQPPDISTPWMYSSLGVSDTCIPNKEISTSAELTTIASGNDL